MPIAYVQSTFLSGTGSTSKAFGANVTAGSLLVVGTRIGSTSITVSSVTDNNGNPAYTQAFSEISTGSGDGLYCYFVANANAGATTITITLTSSTPSNRLAIAEYSGLASVGPLDQVASTRGNSGNYNSPAVTISQGNELLIGMAEVASDNTFTAGTGYTIRENVPAGAGLQRYSLEDKVVSTVGSYDATFTGTPFQWSAGIATFSTGTATVVETNLGPAIYRPRLRVY